MKYKAIASVLPAFDVEVIPIQCNSYEGFYARRGAELAFSAIASLFLGKLLVIVDTKVSVERMCDV